MPSPFPGMDLFLEAPAVFAGFHNRFVTHLSEHIQARLPPPYYADMTDRVWVESTHLPTEPDVNVLRAEVPTPPGAARQVAEASLSSPVVVHVPADECHEAAVEIYARLEDERLVTTIELLSPSNKAPGKHGRDLYLRKQQEVLGSKVHLVEIDLLRGGPHTTAVPLARAREKAGAFDYHVCVHAFDNPEDYLVYPVLLVQRLPVIPVPLLPGDDPLPVDLQAVFDRCYDAGPYRQRLRYAGPVPPPPLSAEQAEWVSRVLREKGLLAG